MMTDPPDDLNQRFGNYISMQDLEEELNWLNEEGYYYPTWKEVRDYVDGKLLLPDKSIVLCFDDGAVSFLENGIPVLEKCKTPATCFMITSYNGEEKIAQYQSDYDWSMSRIPTICTEAAEISDTAAFSLLFQRKTVLLI